MSSELQEKVRIYREDLETQLKNAKNERKELLNKVNNGEILTRKEAKRNQELVNIIKELEEKLSVFIELDTFTDMEKDLNNLKNSKTSKTEKDKISKRLISNFKKLNKELEIDLLSQTDLEAKDLKNLDAAKQKINDEIAELEVELKVAKRKNYDTSDIEEEIENEKDTLELIEEYEKSKFDISEIENDLTTLANPSTSKDTKDAIILKYTDIIKAYKDTCVQEIANIIENNQGLGNDDNDDDLEKKSLKERTKEKLAEISETLKKNGKKIATVAGAVVLTIALILVAKSCSKQIENDDNKELSNNQPGIEQIDEKQNKALVDSLVNKGYQEYYAVLMVENFDKDTIDTLLNSPYNPYVENYANEKDFNLNYIMDYENARTIYNLTADKAIDYVNRSYKIQETGFYNDATINEIVAVVKAVDDKQTFMIENNEQNQSITASLTEIYNNYAFNNVSLENDIKKLDALKYFAKDGSELDLFLEEYAELAKSVLSSKGDNELSEKTKQNMYNYLDIFANTYAGNRTDVENINENAVLVDTYDWTIAYKSFVNPLISTFITEKNVEDYACLQINMLSNYEQWAQVNGCYLENEEKLTLGGE